MGNKRSRKLARGIAGAMLMAAGSAAYASVITPVLPDDVPAPAAGQDSKTTVWDVDADGAADFQFTFRFPNTFYKVKWQSRVGCVQRGVPGNAIAGFAAPRSEYATNFVANSVIDSAIPSNVVTHRVLSWRRSTEVILGSVYANPYSP